MTRAPTDQLFGSYAAGVWARGTVLWHLVLPSITLATVIAAGYIRYVCASMLEVIRQDYVRTARAKGLAETVVLHRHAFKNAAIPLVTLMGLDLPRIA